MVLESLNISTTESLLVFVIFVLFILVSRKAKRIAANAIWIVVSAVLFPFVASRFLGFNVPNDLNTIMTFMLFGLGAYALYLIARAAYSTVKFAGRFSKKNGQKVKEEKQSYDFKKSQQSKDKPVPDFVLRKKIGGGFSGYVKIEDLEKKGNLRVKDSGEYVEIIDEAVPKKGEEKKREKERAYRIEKIREIKYGKKRRK